jgi:hypothetical protein
MKRRFNYTERVRIAKSAIKIDLYNDTTGVQCFDADLNLADRLPSQGHCYFH